MAGGQGTRFWPRSRRRLPKQLLALTGRRTLLQETVRRLLPLFSWRRIVVVTNSQQAAEVRRQLPRLPAEQVLVEPIGRNTLACLVLAAEWIRARAGETTMVAVPADHVILDTEELRRTVARACRLASARACLVTIGVRPTRPETGYGYIEVGQRIPREPARAHWVRRFHEKPAAAQARRYVASGRFVWNSGMFVWKLTVFRQALETCMPGAFRSLSGIWGARPGASRRLRQAYRRLPSVSVDVGVLQPLSRRAAASPPLAVLPGRFDWNDVGSWVALHELWGCDADGNAALGRTVAIDTSNAIVYSPQRLVALVGVDDVIVVDSADAVLICARERAQDVRKITELLKQRGLSRYL